MDPWEEMIRKLADAPVEERPEIEKQILEALSDAPEENRQAAIEDLRRIFHWIDQTKKHDLS